VITAELHKINVFFFQLQAVISDGPPQMHQLTLQFDPTTWWICWQRLLKLVQSVSRTTSSKKIRCPLKHLETVLVHDVHCLLYFCFVDWQVFCSRGRWNIFEVCVCCIWKIRVQLIAHNTCPYIHLPRHIFIASLQVSPNKLCGRNDHSV